MKIVKHHSRKEALDFFERFNAYSAEWIRRNIPALHKNWPTRNRYETNGWTKASPFGHILHYTAGINFEGTIRHFVEGGRASSHWVVSKSAGEESQDLKAQFGLAAQLSADAIQVVHPKSPAWHAGWVNRLCLGTENRNVGILRPYPKDPPKGMPRKPPRNDEMKRDDLFRFADLPADQLDFYWWYDGWTAPFKGEVFNVGGSWWETWSRAQLATNIVILRYAASAWDLDPAWMLAHHNVNPHKNDVVLPIPLDKLRHAILFDESHVDNIEWLAEYDDVEECHESADDPWMIRELDERQASRAEEDLHDFSPDDFDGDGELSPGEVAEALRRFGFWVDSDRDVVASIRIYQRSRELAVDGVAGPATRGILSRELKSWRIEHGL